mgnify:CR=1 FL=1
MIPNIQKINLVAKALQERKFKTKKSGNFLVITDKNIRFAIHKKLFNRVSKIKNARKINAIILEHLNLIVV